MKSTGQLVYYVEKNSDGDWVYTGESSLPDARWNEWSNNFKQRICNKLNELVQNVSDKVTTFLNDNLIPQLENCGPFVKIMEVVSKVPSLTTIIDWAKGIIDFVTGIFKMIFSIYQLVMTILEIVIVRVPQLISKIIKKITEYDCSISPKIAKVKINTLKPSTKKGKK
jgi:hypothetical protein